VYGGKAANMTFSGIMNGPLLYGLVIVAIAYVLIFSVFTLRRSYRHSLELGLDKSKIKGILVSAVLYSIIPSLSIVVGLFSLAAVLGVPWSWFRLSVVGSLMYELMAADLVATGAGYSSIAALGATGDINIIGTIMFVMSISILGGIVGVLLFGKSIQKNINKMHSKGPFAVLAIGVLQLALMVVYLPSMLTSGAVYIAVLLTSAVIALLHQFIIKKTGWRWLANFIMADSLILGMLSSLVWTKVF